ncbi:MAG TPA: hypothetical protein VMS86_09720, partial [Thermoanaerobaculia bacterium]|nr:hypothetical protein [Thermoanaerobaculia bacterium]
MASRTFRVAVGIVVALVLVVALAVAAAVWLVSTEAGARLVLARVGQLMPGRVELGTVEGPLRGPLRLENVVYTRNGMRLEIAELVLRWELRALLRRQVDVHQLAASGVRLHTTPGEESDAPFELPQIDLPVNLVVRQASLRDVVVTVGGGEPIRIRSADFATSTRGETVVIESFDLDSPDLAFEVSGSLTPLGAYAVDLEIAWDFRAPDGTRYRGAGTLDGTLEDLVVRQRLVEPVAVRVEARLLDPLDDLRFEAGLEAAAVELTAIDEGWPAAEVSADLVVTGTLDALEVRGEVLARSEDYGTFRAELAVAGGGERWRIERLRLLPEREAGTMLVQGEVVLGDPARFDLQAEWENLRWPLGASTAEATALAPSGSIAIEGTTEEYRLAGRVRVGLPGLLAGKAKVPLWIDADLVAVGDRGGARIERLEGAALGGRITGEGDVSWEPAVAWSLDLRLEDVEPGRIEPRLEGAVDLAVSTEGTMTEGGHRGVVTLSDVAGTLQGEPVRGQGRVELRGEEYGIPELRLAWADAEIEASGVVGETVDLRFSLNAPDLRRLLAGLEGSLAVAGAVTGTRESPGLQAEVSGRSLVLGDFSAAEIAGNAVAGPGPRDPFEIALVAETLSYGELAFASARVTANGTRADHSLEAALAGGSPPIERVELAARGGLVERQWSGTVAQLVFVPEETQVWTLASPAAIAAGPELVRLDGVCLSSSGQRVCATAAWRGAEDWTLEASAADVSLARVGRFYREDLDLEGIVDATVSAAATAGGGVRGSAVATAEEGSFVLPGETELAGRRFFRGASVRAVAGANGTRADAEVELVDVGELEGFLELPEWSTLAMPPPEEPLRGAFVARASSLEPLVLVSDAFARPRGRLEADLEVAGTVGEPRLEGSARLTEASAFVVPLGITIEDVEL